MPNNDKTAQAFDLIEQGVKDVYSSDKFKTYLSCLSKFHNYSLNNTLLILQQNPNATHVAGYNSWKYNFNRQVNKGEKGLIILAPFPKKEKRIVNTFQQDNMQFYEVVDDPFKQNELNQFMNGWLKNIPDQKYKVNTIYTEDSEIISKKEISKFCKEHGIEKMAPTINKGIER